MPISVNWLAVNSEAVEAGELWVAVVGVYLPSHGSEHQRAKPSQAPL